MLAALADGCPVDMGFLQIPEAVPEQGVVRSIAFGSQSSEEIETLSCFSAFFSRMQSMSASPLSC